MLALRIAGFSLVLFLGSVPGQSPEQPLPEVDINITSVLPTQFAGPIFGRVKCDKQGNLYLRGYIAPKTHRAPIQKLTSEGNVSTLYRSGAADPDFFGMAFFVTPEGHVYQVGYTPDKKVYVLEFGDDGSIKTNTSIGTEFFVPYQLAVFKSGHFLMSGTGGPGQHSSFTAVFDPSGKLIRNVSPPEDDELNQRAGQGDNQLALQSAGGTGNSAVSFGDAVAGSDGNVYLMRSATPALIYVVSASGEIVRTFRVDSGHPRMRAVALKSAEGRIAVVFREENSPGAIIKVTDYEGAPLGWYRSDDRRTPAAFCACYTPPSFKFFVSNATGNGQVFTAESK